MVQHFRTDVHTISLFSIQIRCQFWKSHVRIQQIKVGRLLAEIIVFNKSLISHPLSKPLSTTIR
jgi:hypothetical protein